MADFSTPFGDEGEKRLPTPTEQEEGFLCGPAARELFTGLFNRLEAELGDLHSFAGIPPTNLSMTSTREAVLALIDAATGGGDPSTYVTYPQARARLPIYPEVVNTDGRIIVTAVAPGTVRVPGGVNFLHRGIFQVTTAQTDLFTDASKIYHVRWDPTNGFRLRDLADTVDYNTGSASETNEIFDSVFDDMLVARVVTNSSNVATITNLANKNVLVIKGENVAARGSLTAFQYQDGVAPSAITQYATANVNFARTPMTYMTAINDLLVRPTGSPPGGPGTDIYEFNLGCRALNRYQVAVWAQGDADIWVGWAARA